MSATTEPQQVPDLTIFSRVAAIPLINESLSVVHSTLISNTYFSTPYVTAQNLSKSAYQYSEPIQIRFAPILVRVNGYANMGLDAVESRYPVPFKLTAEEIKQDLKQRSDSAYSTANKTIDERVKTPAYTVVHAIDQRFTPIVDIVESAVNKLHSKNGDEPPKSPTTDYQYQRAFALSKDFREQIARYSAEQFKQIESQSTLVKRASETAHNISDVASSSYIAAQSRVHSLSDTMLQELQRIQASTSTLPSQVQSSLRDVSDGISSSIHDLSGILGSDAPLNEKVTKVKNHVQDKVHPLLDAATVRVQEILKVITSKGEGAKEKAQNGVNGHANNHS